MEAALSGLRILDMTQYEAGTSSTQMLAWLGADVVKIESPRGDPGRRAFAKATEDSQYFINYNSNKRSVVLDLKHPEARQILLDMLPKFDAFVENFGPGVMEDLKLDYPDMCAVNPEIIYVRIKGYGLSGPHADWKCFDQLAQAASGAISVTGDAAGPPIKPGPTMADTGTGMQAALALTAAWVQKMRTGKGQLIELSMQEVMTMFMRTTGVTEWNRQPAPRRANNGGAPTGMYPCKPGGPNDYVFMNIANTRMWDQLCIAIDRPDLLTDPRFASGRLRIQNSAALLPEIANWAAQHTKFEAQKILCEGGVAAHAVYDTMEVFGDEHLNARGFFHKVEHPQAGTLTLMGSPIRMGRSSVPIKAAPLLGADTGAVLAEELGLSAEALQELDRKGAIGLAETRKEPEIGG